MKAGPGEPTKNPFLRENPFELFAKAQRDRASLLRRLQEELKEALKQMQIFCRNEKEFANAPVTLWPGKECLEKLSKRIISLANVQKRGRKNVRASIRALQNRYKSLMLSRSIENLVTRAARLYQEPFAIQIQRQGIAGNERATECFEALRRCRDRVSAIVCEDWERHREVLLPESVETCQTRAAQVVIDWLVDDRGPQKPWDPLVSWLVESGNLALASKLMHPERHSACVLALEYAEKERLKRLRTNRMQKHLLRRLPEKSMMRAIGDPKDGCGGKK
jgi:hypothetical protein